MGTAAAPVSALPNDVVEGLHMLVVLTVETVLSDVVVILNNLGLEHEGYDAVWLDPGAEHALHMLDLVFFS